MGYQEQKSAARLRSELKQAGFEVRAGVADMPTSFVASYGSGRPVIGLIAHVDTTPETPGGGVVPILHEDSAGGPIVLPGDPPAAR